MSKKGYEQIKGYEQNGGDGQKGENGQKGGMRKKDRQKVGMGKRAEISKMAEMSKRVTNYIFHLFEILLKKNVRPFFSSKNDSAYLFPIVQNNCH